MTSMMLFVTQLALPLYLIYDVWRGRHATRLMWCLRAAASASFLALIVVTGRWDVIGYYLRFVLPAMFTAAALAGYLRARRVPWLVAGRAGSTAMLIGSVISLLFFAGLLAYAVQGFWYDGDPVRLTSPLQGGSFYVGQGGDSPLINYHNTHATQRYAMDIVELNGAGVRATSLFPDDLGSYVIFRRPVRSPCSGTIEVAVDGLVDNVPPKRDRDNASGNHVIVECQGVRVLLAHLQHGSVSVHPGESIAAGELVGRVGNSGNTSEPHLHIHAVRGGTGRTSTAEVPVPILLDDRFAVRNTVIQTGD